MSAHDPDPSDALPGRLAALRTAVTDAQAALAGGEEIDLPALQAEVDDLCRRLAGLPKADAAAHLPQLTALEGELDGLEGMMRSRLSGISAELKQHGTRQQAVRAYGRGPAGGEPRG